MPIANARMYSATPELKAAWKELLAWVLRHGDLPWTLMDYDAPAPLNALWARDDLGIAMMCGLPFGNRVPRPAIVAAPIPSPTRYLRQPIYCTDIVVRTDAPFQSIEDTFGQVAGYTLADSMSGGVAFNAFLERYRTPQRRQLYRQSVGSLIHARGVIGALASGAIDVGPLDSYYHDLLKHNDTAFAAQVRTIASTEMVPIPPLVATTALTEREHMRLRAGLQAAIEEESLRATRERLLLAGFAFPQAADYDAVAAVARRPMAPFDAL